MDVKTGAVRAMIGGHDSHFNRAVQARRQPGSTFKAFVWAAALNAGMTAASLIEDAPLAYYYDGRDCACLRGRRINIRSIWRHSLSRNRRISRLGAE